MRRIPESYAALYAPLGRTISLTRARAQHEKYAEALRAGGLHVSYVNADETLPDCVFIEDCAVVWGDEALIASVGQARSGEEAGVAAALSQRHTLSHVEVGSHLEGGDVLHAEARTYVGLSGRTNAAGAAEVARLMTWFGRETVTVPVERCLHLKCAVSWLGEGTVAIAPDLVDPAWFDGLGLVEIEAAESAAANCVRVGDRLLVAAGYPRAERALSRFARQKGLKLSVLDISEFETGDGSLSCLSIPRTAGP